MENNSDDDVESGEFCYSEDGDDLEEMEFSYISESKNKEYNERIRQPKTLYEKETGTVSYYKLPTKNGVIILMEHPASFTAYSHVEIESLLGTVSVLGYEISPGQKAVKVMSTEKTGLIEVQTESVECIWKKKGKVLSLDNLIFNITESAKFTENILRYVGKSTVVVIVKRIPYTPNLYFLQLYYPSIFDLTLYKGGTFKTANLYINENAAKRAPPPVRFGVDAEHAASEINMNLRSAKLAQAHGPRTIVIGSRNVGKSSLLRYFINKILTVHCTAFYLDADPGQSEFTPPGVVSLTKVEEPIFGPPFFQLKNPATMIFTGSISVGSHSMYVNSLTKLMQLYRKKYSDEPLFVNTMGWMEGFGLECLKDVIRIVKPTVMVEVSGEMEFSMFDYREHLPQDCTYFHVKSRGKVYGKAFSAEDMRNFALLSYIGQHQTAYRQPVLINEMKPFCICWDKIPIYLYNSRIPPYRLVESLNQSVVALCKAPERDILVSEIPTLPKTLRDEAENQCFGFGIVRAIDETNHLLYIVTPLTLEQLKKVNCIIKGNMQIPEAVILKQGLYEEEIPYLYNRPLSPKLDEEPDISKVSLIQSNKRHSVSNTTPYVSSDSLQKKIRQRYQKGFR